MRRLAVLPPLAYASTVMNLQQLLDPAYLQSLLAEAVAWAQSNVLVLDSAVQFAVVALGFMIALATASRVHAWLEKPWDAPLYERFGRPVALALAPLSLPVVWLMVQWFAVFAAENAGWPHHLITVVVSLLTAWVVIRLAATLIRNAAWARAVTIAAWIIAALSITGLLDPTMAVLDSMALNAGEIRVSVLSVIKGLVALGVLLWVAGALANLVERRVGAIPGVSPAAGVLFGKLFRIGIITLAVVIGLDSVGIDLTAFAVFSGAVGLGIGFGLQKVFSNLISGVILLMDRSVKPGDVIAIGDTFGWINSLKARYVSVITRDGTEHLIPNEELISQRVENWSHTNQLVRLKIGVGIDYNADVEKAMELTVEAAKDTNRVLEDPKPVARLMAFGDNAVDLELRVWIRDPKNGVANVRSEVLLGIWKRYQEHGIDFPYPQRDIHLTQAVPLEVSMSSPAGKGGEG